MREFGKTPRESTILKVLKAILNALFTPKRDSFGSHYDRMQKRRRKNRFDR